MAAAPQNLQLHGNILGHHDTDVPPGHSLAPATPDASAADTSDPEAHILFNDVSAEDIILFDDVFDDNDSEQVLSEVHFTQHLLASESSFWKGYCKSQRPPAPPPFSPPPSPFDHVTSTTKRFALDLRSGEVIDAKGYICAGQNVGDVDSREHLITRALIKGLKTHAKALKTRHTVNAIALLRNPKTVKEALASPEYSQWIAAIHAEMSSLIDKQTFEVCPTPHRQRWSH